jgi:hypothetical protein
MNYETAQAYGPGSTNRTKPIRKQQRKRGSLITAVNNQLAMIAKEKREPTTFERARIDSATNMAFIELKMRIARLK